MVIVVPSLAEGEDRADYIVATLVGCIVWPGPKKMTNGVNAPSSMVD